MSRAEFLLDLTAAALVRRLAGLEDPARQRPVIPVVRLDQQHPAVRASEQRPPRRRTWWATGRTTRPPRPRRSQRKRDRARTRTRPYPVVVALSACIHRVTTLCQSTRGRQTRGHSTRERDRFRGEPGRGVRHHRHLGCPAQGRRAQAVRDVRRGQPGRRQSSTSPRAEWDAFCPRGQGRPSSTLERVRQTYRSPGNLPQSPATYRSRATRVAVTCSHRPCCPRSPAGLSPARAPRGPAAMSARSFGAAASRGAEHHRALGRPARGQAHHLASGHAVGETWPASGGPS